MSEQTFLFADLAGFTALTEHHGDDDAAELALGFAAASRELLDCYGAREIKTIGDAIFVRSPDPAGAIRLGLRIATDVGERHGFPMVRVGMHTGPAVERDGDWFGATVNLASRVSAEATAGQVLLTERTSRAAGPIAEVELQPRGRRVLRNVEEPVVLLEAVAKGSTTAEGLSIDPVCKMAVDPAHEAGRLLYEDRVFHFCSLDCAAAFSADPVRHAS